MHSQVGQISSSFGCTAPFEVTTAVGSLALFRSWLHWLLAHEDQMR
jgi:hypothetical protein